MKFSCCNGKDTNKLRAKPNKFGFCECGSAPDSLTLLRNLPGFSICIDFERDNLTITTHSPFVIYALNNCMMAYTVKEKAIVLNGALAFSGRAWIDPAKVSVWELRDGYIQAPGKERNATIQGSDGLIRNNYFDRVMNGMMADFKNLLSLSRL